MKLLATIRRNDKGAILILVAKHKTYKDCDADQRWVSGKKATSRSLVLSRLRVYGNRCLSNMTALVLDFDGITRWSESGNVLADSSTGLRFFVVTVDAQDTRKVWKVLEYFECRPCRLVISFSHVEQFSGMCEAVHRSPSSSESLPKCLYNAHWHLWSPIQRIWNSLHISCSANKKHKAYKRWYNKRDLIILWVVSHWSCVPHNKLMLSLVSRTHEVALWARFVLIVWTLLDFILGELAV